MGNLQDCFRTSQSSDQQLIEESKQHIIQKEDDPVVQSNHYYFINHEKEQICYFQRKLDFEIFEIVYRLTLNFDNLGSRARTITNFTEQLLEELLIPFPCSLIKEIYIEFTNCDLSTELLEGVSVLLAQFKNEFSQVQSLHINLPNTKVLQNESDRKFISSFFQTVFNLFDFTKQSIGINYQLRFTLNLTNFQFQGEPNIFPIINKSSIKSLTLIQRFTNYQSYVAYRDSHFLKLFTPHLQHLSIVQNFLQNDESYLNKFMGCLKEHNSLLSLSLKLKNIGSNLIDGIVQQSIELSQKNLTSLQLEFSSRDSQFTREISKQFPIFNDLCLEELSLKSLGKRELNFHHAVTPYLSCLKHFRKFEIEDFTTSPLTIQLAERILENNKETLTYVSICLSQMKFQPGMLTSINSIENLSYLELRLNVTEEFFYQLPIYQLKKLTKLYLVMSDSMANLSSFFEKKNNLKLIYHLIQIVTKNVFLNHFVLQPMFDPPSNQNDSVDYFQKLMKIQQARQGIIPFIFQYQKELFQYFRKGIISDLLEFLF